MSPLDEHSITVQFWIILYLYVTTEVWGNGKYGVFACRDQVPVASEQNIYIQPFLHILGPTHQPRLYRWYNQWKE